MAGKLQDKGTVITGGNSGIGLATAREFKANGASVVIFGRNRQTLDEAASSLGPGSLAVQGDVRKLGDIDRLFEQVAKTFDKIDVLVANADVAICNSSWGELMYRLKKYVEGKNPGPHWTE